MRHSLTKLATALGALAATTSLASQGEDLSRQVEIRRTEHGVPHIKAQNLRAGAYALAWVQLEDYGPRIASGLLRARGEMARFYGYDSIEGDFAARRARARAIETYPKLDQETRDVYDGFAAGVNRYIELHRDSFPAGFPATFTGYDVAARDIGRPAATAARSVLARIDTVAARRGGGGASANAPQPSLSPAIPPLTDADIPGPDDGSNAWALAPSRTKSGKAILLRNPHLAWTAGYYEGHLTVPGVIDFYGDFRIGGPFGVVGGFNPDLGWATTNNAPDLDEVYSLDVDPERVDHYLFDGTSIPLKRELISVEYKNGPGLSSETREVLSTPLGPVVYRGGGKIYVIKSAGDGDFGHGEQFLRMMRAKTFAEWKDAMQIRARINSNFTYADRAGNIYYVWNASLPLLPHAPGGDTVAIHATRMSEVWTQYVAWDSLPQFFNPKGGYVHNENDAPYFTNLRVPLDTTKRYPNFPATEFDLRSQHSVALIGGDEKFSLEDVVKLKHSYRMLLAERVKKDLVDAVRATQPTGDVAAAIDLVAKWDNTVSPESKGSVLFEAWWRRYVQGRPRDSLFAINWSSALPATTPSGLADRARAASTFAVAVTETARRYGAFDVAWGDVHRVRRGNVDVPVGGCSGDIGCFRVLTYRADRDGKLVANGSDGWILAVEFGDVPRAYSVLAYGESPNETSPWFADQAEMFARGELKKVAFLDKDVEAATVLRYRPGASR